jgi:hypothetical protein
MVIPEACIEVEEEDGSFSVYASSPGFTACGEPSGDLQMPSYGTSGLKIGMPGGSVSVDGDSRILLLDFDVQESFGKLAGASGMWVMDPNVRAEDVSFAASLTVELTEGEGSGLAGVGGVLSDFEAHLDSEAVPVAFSDSDGDGTWTASFLFLMPGTHEVSIEAADGVTYDVTLDPETPQSVTLSSGARETVSFVLTSASAP